MVQLVSASLLSKPLYFYEISMKHTQGFKKPNNLTEYFGISNVSSMDFFKQWLAHIWSTHATFWFLLNHYPYLIFPISQRKSFSLRSSAFIGIQGRYWKDIMTLGKQLHLILSWLSLVAHFSDVQNHRKSSHGYSVLNFYYTPAILEA